VDGASYQNEVSVFLNSCLRDGSTEEILLPTLRIVQISQPSHSYCGNWKVCFTFQKCL